MGQSRAADGESCEKRAAADEGSNFVAWLIGRSRFSVGEVSTLLGGAAAPALERDDFCLNRHPALAFWWSMISFRKPVSTPDQVRGRLFRDHALGCAAGVDGEHRAGD